ncbi:MAG: putative exonuclease of the beta-lactamase fold involved in RNA processing [Phormidesmis priestleyi Ana]|uniref:Putative exonuclease of the beta-lactamase fold involved in RNA processing n=1 Tax=Phormidesmis priestleyi Ana TaxID=1666911 RepID=A0A0P8A1Y5_9CYAN|nr:MAG: putative exonuclease of the beta-lactamase fold involved in RNA processing [Phormidesmis priestleyi Ana]
MTELSCLPYSVGYEDEGVCLSIRIGPYSILLDCGLADIGSLREEAADFVFCSHAHTDHCRGLLALHRSFPHLPIFSSDVTARLLPLNWPGQEDTAFCRSLPWRSPTELAPGLSVRLWPSGHLPGAAAFFITYKTPQRTYSVFYSGDCFLSNGRLVDGLPLAELRNLKPDVLIIEGSYGIERHPHRKQQENYLVDRLSQALVNHGRAVFPSPLLGLGQELLMLVRSHHHFTGQPIDVWVDPAIAAGCDAYLGCLSALPVTVQNFAQHQPLFWDERVLPRVRRLGGMGGYEATPKMPEPDSPAIFIVHPATHPSAYCQDDPAHWTVFVPSLEDIALWQSQLTQQGYGPQFDWPEFDWLEEMRSHTASGTAETEHYMLTNHSDGGGTTQLIHNLRPQHVIFVHGRMRQLGDLASLDDLQSRYQLHLPTPEQVIDLPLAESFWQPAPPRDILYEGEVNATAERVTLTLPTSLEGDPRWTQLADTGIVEAMWQGDQLVIRGLNQQELMRTTPRDPIAAARTCYFCRHLRGQRCRNPESPLVGLQVTSDGTCDVFERSVRSLG